jgi:hypothetical protein
MWVFVCESFGGRRDCLDVGVRVRIVRWSERDCLDVGVGVRIVRWSERDCLDVGVRVRIVRWADIDSLRPPDGSHTLLGTSLLPNTDLH